MTISKKCFGKLSDGREVSLYTIRHENGLSLSLTDYGAAVVSLLVPDREGKLRDVVLGCDSAEDYETQTACLGAVPGRVANRIKEGKFTLNGQEYSLEINNGPNHLHGGSYGFHRRLWNSRVAGNSVIFSRLSPDGEGGYPGNLVVSVTYTFSEEGKLSIDYKAISDQDTIINLTNHTYFNLNSHNSGTALGHELKIFADSFTENDENCLPTGRIVSLDAEEAGPMDFRTPKILGERIHEENVHLKNGSGYDHNYILNKKEGNLAAIAYAPESGIQLCCYTTQPGVQLYTGNFLETSCIVGKGKTEYKNRDGFCLETQHYPAATSYEHFPNVVLTAGTVYEEKTEYCLSCRNTK